MIAYQRSSQARISYVDLFRAVGIILMIMGHVWFGRVFDTFIHAFHMPMFFFAAGFFFRDCEDFNDVVRRIKKKTMTLLVPYVVYSIVHYIIYFLLMGWKPALLRLFIFNTDEGGIPIAGALWFLTSLFFTNVLYSLLDCGWGYGVKLHITVGVLSVLGNLCGIYLPFRTPFGFDTALVGIGFFHMGRVIRKEKRLASLLAMKSMPMFLTGIAAIVFVFLNKPVNLRKGEYGIIPLFWLTAFACIFFLWNLCRRTDNLLTIKTSRLHLYLTDIGSSSIIYLCLNQIAILFSQKVISLLHPNVYLNAILVFSLAMLLLKIAKLIIFYTPLRVTVGKN